MYQEIAVEMISNLNDHEIINLYGNNIMLCYVMLIFTCKTSQTCQMNFLI